MYLAQLVQPHKLELSKLMIAVSSWVGKNTGRDLSGVCSDLTLSMSRLQAPDHDMRDSSSGGWEPTPVVSLTRGCSPPDAVEAPGPLNGTWSKHSTWAGGWKRKGYGCHHLSGEPEAWVKSEAHFRRTVMYPAAGYATHQVGQPQVLLAFLHRL
ncbi:hypothetical protein N657DRAFT_161467 [Parathielavia appendiculata]|uniref:Uncharacterized protein n=1 Tax=Parathielavia appendiculata TaxID=2587402 RepID=A0AAN6Z1D6_9PEZI|nr:hypothetical protein N657DRAFT_161467 [Parathielavia appendiculata]